MAKAFYIVVEDKLATAHDTLPEAQRALYETVRLLPNTTVYICEVLPRERIKNGRHEYL